jgi:hypothetical protein
MGPPKGWLAAPARPAPAVRTRWSDLLARLNPRSDSLRDVQSDGHGAVIFDASETLYLVCPAAWVRCDEQALARLLGDLDAVFWNDPPRASIRYQRLSPPERILCGYTCCSVVYTGGFWLHPRFTVFDVEAAVTEVLAGRIPALPWPLEGLLRKAKAAEPTCARWPRRLAELFHARMSRAAGEERIALAAEALAEYEAVLALGYDYRRDLLPAVTCAFEAGAYRTAAGLADRLLTDSWRDVARGRWDDVRGRCICLAHTVLGRIDTRAGDDNRARARLAEAGKAPFTPGPGTERPDAVLLAELSGRA